MDVCNCVGLLQEKCSKMKISPPCYSENDSDSNIFKFTCSLGELTTVGTGCNKKTAKQNAAKSMISKLESEGALKASISPFVNNTVTRSAVSCLFEYCSKEKKVEPLFSEKPKEDELIVVECSFDGYVGIGKEFFKKEAKEKSADQVLKHFDIYRYFENLKKIELRINSLKNPVSELNELCQVKKFKNAIYKEEISLDGNIRLYEFVCTVGDKQSKSSQKVSKKDAKNEAARLMLNILDKFTAISLPIESPIPCEQNEDPSSLAKRQIPNKQDEDILSPTKKLKI